LTASDAKAWEDKATSLDTTKEILNVIEWICFRFFVVSASLRQSFENVQDGIIVHDPVTCMWIESLVQIVGLQSLSHRIDLAERMATP
jgi:hypothetical protein